MQRFSLAAPAALALTLAIVAAACSGPAAPSATPAPTGTPVVTPAPVVTPSPAVTPSPKPSAAPSPSDGAGDGAIDLDVALGHDVSVVVTDRGAGLVDARSGHAGDGMSVRWGDAIVENLDAHTVQVTWAGYPRDEIVGLVVEPRGDGVLLRFGQAAPYPNSDAMGADRVMVFSFAEPVAADDVVVEFTTADD